MKKYLFLLLIMSASMTFAKRDSHSLETLKVQKKIETSMLLDQRRKIEVMRGNAKIRYSMKKSSGNLRMQSNYAYKPKNHAPQFVLDKIRKSK